MPYIQTMSELEAVATRKEEAADAAGETGLVGKIVGGVALGAVAAVAAGVMKRRHKIFDEVIVPQSALPDRSSIPVAAAATRERMQAIVDDSLRPEEVAESLGIALPTVVKRIQRRNLYSFEDEQGRLLPKFQFRERRTVRHLEKIMPLLEPDLHPIEVVNWFTYPHTDLVIGDEPVSPVEWLEAGGDGAVVVELANELGSGV